MTHHPRPTPSSDRPFAYFQWNYGWGVWEQVVESAKDEPGVVAAYASPRIKRSKARPLDLSEA